MFDRWKSKWLPSRRRRMISETEVFLTAALRKGGRLPRVPRRRVDSGGFSEMLRRPGGREAAAHWWARTLRTVEAFEERS